MFGKLFEALYLKVLVNIVIKHATTVVYIELHSKKGSVDNVHNEFDTLEVDEKILEFINNYTKESPYYYITLLDNAKEQGALPTCSKQKFSYYTDLSNCEYRCYKDRWLFYTAKPELYALEKKYKAVGVDFIFSPFVLLAHFFKDKIDATLALYVLIEEVYITLSVFENSELLYSEHINMYAKNSEIDDILLTEEDLENSVEDLDLDIDGSIDLEDIGVDDPVIENLGDIEDLDALEELDEFDESKDAEEELLENAESYQEDVEENFNEDYQRFTLIQSSIANFYKDERYESRFLENIYIADGVGVSSDLKKYFEEEMFLNVYVRHTELDAELCELAKEELGL